MDGIIGLIVGLISGMVFEKLGSTPWNNFQTLVPSLLIENSGKRFHLHHWIIYLSVFLIIAFVTWKTDRMFHPAVIFVLSFLAGSLIFGFLKFPDWLTFIK